MTLPASEYAQSISWDWFQSYPKPGQKVAVEAYSKQGGGNTGTALTAATRLGAKTAYIGKLGRDEYSQFLLDEFQKEGVDIRQVIFEEGAQPHVSFIHVDKKTGERRIARYWQEFRLNPGNLNRPVIQNSKILFLDHYYTDAGFTAVKWIKQNGGTIVVDAERDTPGFDRILALADYVITSSEFAESKTGMKDLKRAARLLQEKFGNIVVVTGGGKGAFCSTPDQQHYQPAFAVEAVDTTGAGDVFHGAFMIGLLENWPLPKTLEFSSAVAALKCRGLGGRAMIPSKVEALTFLKENGTAPNWHEM